MKFHLPRSLTLLEFFWRVLPTLCILLPLEVLLWLWVIFHSRWLSVAEPAVLPSLVFGADRALWIRRLWCCDVKAEEKERSSPDNAHACLRSWQGCVWRSRPRQSILSKSQCLEHTERTDERQRNVMWVFSFDIFIPRLHFKNFTRIVTGMVSTWLQGCDLYDTARFESADSYQRSLTAAALWSVTRTVNLQGRKESEREVEVKK